MPAHFTPETFRFLRSLTKNNSREWFEERRPVYERALRAPLLAVVEEVNAELAEFAPDFVRPAHKIAMRIFRDTRFSPDKRPYKNNVAAWWSQEGLQKTSAAGFFFQTGPAGSFAAAGVYAPEREDLLLIRRWLAEHHESYREHLDVLLGARGQGRIPLEPNPLTRNPKGFAPDHLAGDLLRARNWGVVTPLTPEQVLDPGLAAAVAAQFREMTPLVRRLNEPFLERHGAAKAHKNRF